MKQFLKISANLMGAVALLAMLTGSNLNAQSTITFDFEDGTDQGWGNPFSADPDDMVMLPVDFIGGSNRLGVVRDGGFQEAGRRNADGDMSDPFFDFMSLAATDVAGTSVSFDYYVDTTVTDGTFLQIGTFVNDGSGLYNQTFPDVEFDEDALAGLGGDILTGTVSFNLADVGHNIVEGQSAYEFGFILNGDGNQTVWIDNVTFTTTAIPEPASASILALVGVAGFCRRRR